jgi:uncharacterized protein YjbI with pentapeptide repeats
VTESSPPKRPLVVPIPRWLIAVGVPLMVLVAVAAVWLLLGLDVASTQLEAIRTGGTVVVGLGGLVLLWLAVRRQRSTELDLLQKAMDYELAERNAADSLAHQQQVAQDARDDATARRVTELYRQGVDQLGSAKAPVRLGGLYALERLAQDSADPALRQTVVNVVCAYLRMPYTEPEPVRVARPLGLRRRIRPGTPVPTLPAPVEKPAADLDARQEREVRLTAQRILENHLYRGTLTEPPETFWSDIDLDLTAATLIDFRPDQCEAFSANFTGARFLGVTQFGGTRIRSALFEAAEFHGHAWFSNATFDNIVTFARARFEDQVWFREAKFGDNALFESTQFGSFADFDDAEFHGHSSFVDARFAPFQLNTAMWARVDVTLPHGRLWPVSYVGSEPAEWQEDPEPVTRPDRDGTWTRVSFDPLAALE